MRKGYWKALVRRLRSRVASGYDTYVSDSHQALTIVEVLASGDESLDLPAELALAATADGAAFLIDTGDNLVRVRASGTSESESTGLDLPGFIDALCVGNSDAPSIAFYPGD